MSLLSYLLSNQGEDAVGLCGANGSAIRLDADYYGLAACGSEVTGVELCKISG